MNRPYKAFLACNSVGNIVVMARDEAEAAAVMKKTGFHRSYRKPQLEEIIDRRSSNYGTCFQFIEQVNQQRAWKDHARPCLVKYWDSGNGYNRVEVTFAYHKADYYREVVKFMQSDAELLNQITYLADKVRKLEATVKGVTAALQAA